VNRTEPKKKLGFFHSAERSSVVLETLGVSRLWDIQGLLPCCALQAMS